MRRTDPLIVGGGPAGSAAAITLAHAGARPLVIERSRDRHSTVCGAFVSWDALQGLNHLGIDPWALGARPIERVRIIAGDRVLERPLPRRAAGLSRGTLDAALIDRAAALGAGVERGVAARRLEPDGLRLADGTCLATDSLFIATGKHALRGSPREGAAGRSRLGLRTTLSPQPDLDGLIELHLLEGGYAGLLRLENGRTNICLSIDAERLTSSGGSLDRLVETLSEGAPRLGERLLDRGEWSSVSAVPYGWRARQTDPGRFRIGDQAAVIASLAGDGIAMALAGGGEAAKAWLGGGGAAAPDFQRRFARRAARPVRTAEWLRHAAERPALAAPVLSAFRLAPGAVGLSLRLTRIGH